MEYVTQIHTGADGLVQVSVPEEWADKDVTLVLRSEASPLTETSTEQDEWLTFLEETAGSLADDPITRPPQGEAEERHWPADFLQT